MRRHSFYLRWVRRPLWVIFAAITALFLFSLVFTVSWYAPSWRIALDRGTIVVEQGIKCPSIGLHVGLAFRRAKVGLAATTGWYAWRQYNFYWLMYASCLLLIVLPGRPREQEAGTCQFCGYNLTGNVSGVCPECGERV